MGRKKSGYEYLWDNIKEADKEVIIARDNLQKKEQLRKKAYRELLNRFKENG